MEGYFYKKTTTQN